MPYIKNGSHASDELRRKFDGYKGELKDPGFYFFNFSCVPSAIDVLKPRSCIRKIKTVGCLLLPQPECNGHLSRVNKLSLVHQSWQQPRPNSLYQSEDHLYESLIAMRRQLGKDEIKNCLSQVKPAARQ